MQNRVFNPPFHISTPSAPRQPATCGVLTRSVSIQSARLSLFFLPSAPNHRHMYNIWITSKSWTNKSKMLGICIHLLLFLKSGKFIFMNFPWRRKIFTNTDSFHNHSKEMTSSFCERFLLLSEIWGEKFHLSLTEPRKWMMSLLYHKNWYYKLYHERYVLISNPNYQILCSINEKTAKVKATLRLLLMQTISLHFSFLVFSSKNW